jgi:putative Mg2+ transporter-C (MgtC) family protein
VAFAGNEAFDPARIASQIVVGVGFLAGGLIVFNKDQLHGLTTGAGLWVAAAIGMAVGFNFYAIAVFVTVLTLLIFGLFWQIEQKIVQSAHDGKK